MIDQAKKSAMAEIIAAMNRATSEEAPLTETVAPTKTVVASTTGDAKIDAMGDILKRFYQVTETLTESATEGSQLKEALATQQTEAGVVVGSWRIEKSGREYSVVNTATSQPIAFGLSLYEAALGLAKCLNEGKSITHADFKTILRLEEDFTKNFQDAASYKKRYQTSTGHKQMVAEARYGDAKQKALTAKLELKKFTSR